MSGIKENADGSKLGFLVETSGLVRALHPNPGQMLDGDFGVIVRIIRKGNLPVTGKQAEVVQETMSELATRIQQLAGVETDIGFKPGTVVSMWADSRAGYGGVTSYGIVVKDCGDVLYLQAFDSRGNLVRERIHLSNFTVGDLHVSVENQCLSSPGLHRLIMAELNRNDLANRSVPDTKVARRILEGRDHDFLLEVFFATSSSDIKAAVLMSMKGVRALRFSLENEVFIAATAPLFAKRERFRNSGSPEPLLSAFVKITDLLDKIGVEDVKTFNAELAQQIEPLQKEHDELLAAKVQAAVAEQLPKLVELLEGHVAYQAISDDGGVVLLKRNEPLTHENLSRLPPEHWSQITLDEPGVENQLWHISDALDVSFDKSVRKLVAKMTPLKALSNDIQSWLKKNRSE